MMPEKQATSKKNNSWLIIVAVAIMLVVSGIYFSMKDDPIVVPITDKDIPILSQSLPEEKGEKVFNISAKPFEFSMNEIRVKKGDVVRINLEVAQGMHDWVVDEFGAQTKQLKTGEKDSIVFTADKAGTFQYYCSVANHRQLGMIGKLIVEE